MYQYNHLQSLQQNFNSKQHIYKQKVKEYTKKSIFKQQPLKYLKISKFNYLLFQNLNNTYQSTQKKIIKIYIKITLNNIFITYLINNKIYTKSLASIGFKGKSKQTIYAYKTFAESILNDLNRITTTTQPLIITLYINSLSKKLKPLYHILKINNIKINKIYDTTVQSFNGCRKRKIAIKKKRKSVIKFLSYL